MDIFNLYNHNPNDHLKMLQQHPEMIKSIGTYNFFDVLKCKHISEEAKYYIIKEYKKLLPNIETAYLTNFLPKLSEEFVELYYDSIEELLKGFDDDLLAQIAINKKPTKQVSSIVKRIVTTDWFKERQNTPICASILKLVELDQIEDVDKLSSYESIIVSYFSQDDFNPLFYNMIDIYIKKLEELDVVHAKNKVEQLKLMGYKQIDDRYDSEESINYNMMIFYTAMKAYEFGVREYIYDCNKINSDALANYNEYFKTINFNTSKINASKKSHPINCFNYFTMQAINHEVRHAMQYKFEEEFRTMPVEEIDPYAIYYWILSKHFRKDNPKLYKEYHDLFPFEYDAELYSRKEMLEDAALYFPSIPKSLLIEMNADTARFIYNLNVGQNNDSWASHSYHAEQLFISHLDSLACGSKIIIARELKELQKKSELFVDDGKKRFMRGDYNDHLKVIPQIIRGSIKPTNIFEAIFSGQQNVDCSSEISNENPTPKQV